MKLIKILIALVVSAPVFAQQGGMWVPSLLTKENEREMKSLGIKLSAKDIYSVNSSSLKDAVPQFNWGCTAEMVSDKGLLLTNHHCGYSQIQAHSSIQNNYLKDGFWAKSLDQELPNKDTEVAFVIKIEDVTKSVLKGTEGLDAEKKQEIISKNIKDVTENFPKEKWQENMVKAFFDGNQYLVFVLEVFKDVRLVGAPPSAMGQFGADTDNWMYPRHSADFSVFRVYADKNNHPAPYSPDNVPYKPKHFLPVSIAGLKEGDPTIVMGYPGTTKEYIPSYAVEQIALLRDPMNIEIRDAVLKELDKFMRADPKIKIQYASKYAGIANAWKKWQGEVKGVKKFDVVGLKTKQEEDFRKKVAQKNNPQYKNVLDNLKELYERAKPYYVASDVFKEVVVRNSDFYYNAYRISSLLRAGGKSDAEFSSVKYDLLSQITEEFKDYNKDVDKSVFVAITKKYKKFMPSQFLSQSMMGNFSETELADKIYSSSNLTSEQGIKNLLTGSRNEIVEKLKNDVGVAFVNELCNNYFNNIAPKYSELDSKIKEEQKIYTKALLEYATPQDRMFPDANLSLRVTYGKVMGYRPSDAVVYEPYTSLDGVMEKYIPGDYEYDVPQRLRELHQSKNYGQYADKNGKLPVCFVGTNHTTGGNSGSPVINKKGELVGLNFDRVWEGTMSDLHYRPEVCRNVMVDIRYVLFVIDKYAGAENLIKEMQIRK